jgi:hypothetical protein
MRKKKILSTNVGSHFIGGHSNAATWETMDVKLVISHQQSSVANSAYRITANTDNNIKIEYNQHQ